MSEPIASAIRRTGLSPQLKGNEMTDKALTPVQTEVQKNEVIEIMVLDDKVQLCTRDQRLVRVDANVMIDVAAGDVVFTPMGALPTAQFYRKMNKTQGIQLLSPPQTVIEKGELGGNPYITLYPNESPKRITMRRVGIGRSTFGQLMLYDKTFTLNLQTYLLQSIDAKSRKVPECAMLGARDARPNAFVFREINWQSGEKANGEKYRYPEAGDVKKHEVNPAMLQFIDVDGQIGFWFDVSHPEIRAVYSEHIQRQKFAERIAFTIIDRNIIKDATGIGKLATKREKIAGKMQDVLVQDHIKLSAWIDHTDPSRLTKMAADYMETAGDAQLEGVEVKKEQHDVGLDEFDGVKQEDGAEISDTSVDANGVPLPNPEELELMDQQKKDEEGEIS